MTPDEIAREIARCDREIAAMEAQEPVGPAYLTTLGIEDWRWERRKLAEELRRQLPPDPERPGKHIDPATGIWPISEWGSACYQGFVSDSRFGSARVIKRTNRETTRRWRRIERR
jgi:hypothetical protein